LDWQKQNVELLMLEELGSTLLHVKRMEHLLLAVDVLMRQLMMLIDEVLEYC
jgi:hypothetical protein